MTPGEPYEDLTIARLFELIEKVYRVLPDDFRRKSVTLRNEAARLIDW